MSKELNNQKFPESVVNGVKESLRQSDEGELTLYTGVKDMLGVNEQSTKDSPKLILNTVHSER